ncbi:hypothetical protein DQ04_00731080 [Trypanosoma grayi]|uniref:hypothetical protein n=1 Tax=Trypanosoma grayi TaxID=71804 RepID=UPI0004F44972|nr:hypothetical protein DQ04_00731080 [Trypanosoma grayi]KEG13886.1 hypothetical protein DQ04_00731080 [Trypanosoma grayi]
MPTFSDPTMSPSSTPSGVMPLDADVKRLEVSAAGLAREFGELVASYESCAAKAGSATVENSAALLQGVIYLEEQLRGAMTSLNDLLKGMTAMAAAVEGLEGLLNDIRKVAQDVTYVEEALLAAEEGARQLSERRKDNND